MPETQRRRHVWLVGVPVKHDLVETLANRTREPTRSRLREDTLVPRLDHEDEARILRVLMTECPRELDELYRELVRRCGPSRNSERSSSAGIEV